MIIPLDVFLVSCISCFVLGVCSYHILDYIHQKRLYKQHKRDKDKDWRLPSKKQQPFEIIDDE